jgi:hypothetical protein
MIGKAVYHILSNATAVTDLVGDRILRGRAKQGTAHPYVVFSNATTDPVESKDDAQTQDDHIVEVLIFDQDYNKTEAVASAVREALHDYSGDANGVDVVECRFTGGDDEPADLNSILYGVAQDYRIVIKR